MYFLTLLSVTQLCLFIPLYVSYVVLAFYVERRTVFPETLPISHLRKLVKDGACKVIETHFGKRPFYVRSVCGKIAWDKLQARYRLHRGQIREAHEIYCRLLSLPLFEEERGDISFNQIYSRLLLGDTNGAWHLFELLGKPKSRKGLLLRSMFAEKRGEFESARQNLLSAVSDFNDLKDIHLAVVYNNLGRMEKTLGNITNVIHYYQKSAELARELGEKNLIHTVYPNIVDTYLLRGERSNAVSFFERYSELIDPHSVDDLLSFSNYCLEYARQTNDRSLFLEALEKGRKEILPMLSAGEQLTFEVTELRIRWNNQFGWDEKLSWLTSHLTVYIELDFPIRYYCVKEIFSILRELLRRNGLGQFAALFKQVLEFMGEARRDIDQHLLRLPDSCVDERCFWEKEKAFLRHMDISGHSQMDLMNFCEGIFEHLRNVKDIQLQHGNPLSAIEADLNIADECMNLMQIIREPAIIPNLRRTMEKHLTDACKDLERFRRHPASNEYLLRTARYALFLGDQNRAKEYFDDFLRSKISIHHYAMWMQAYYQDLIIFFPTT